MEQRDLLDAQVQAKRMNNLLNEVMDISRQMIEAVDRDDQISVQMLVAMRQEPVSKLQIVDQRMKEQCAALPDPEDGRRLAALLSGGAANAKEELPLVEQIAANARLLRQVIELDQRLSRKLARERSFYGT